MFSGEQWRSVSFLTSQGVPLTMPSAEQQAAGEALLRTMPAHREDGWITVRDGLLLANLGGGRATP